MVILFVRVLVTYFLYIRQKNKCRFSHIWHSDHGDLSVTSHCPQLCQRCHLSVNLTLVVLNILCRCPVIAQDNGIFGVICSQIYAIKFYKNIFWVVFYLQKHKSIINFNGKWLKKGGYIFFINIHKTYVFSCYCPNTTK